ncbi:DUF4328 domain-containing protein [Thermoleophilia bacterium SCSIO 60948]|nr:DUF4328 domain-containing protein [Thermoleophilia bacterium SCSIO 60948]
MSGPSEPASGKVRNEFWRWSGPFEVQPIADRSRVAIALLCLVALAGLGSLWADIGQVGLLGDIRDGARVSLVEANESDDRVRTFAIAYTIAVVLAAIGFLLWYSRAYRNTIALGARDPRYGPGWSIGYWFIPFVNLVRPKQVMNDIWRASDPELDRNASGWRFGRVSPLLHWWWAIWLLSTFVQRFVFRLGFNDDEFSFGTSIDDLYDLAVGYVVADVLDLVAVGLAIATVVKTSARQRERIERSRGWEAEEPAPDASAGPPATATT